MASNHHTLFLRIDTGVLSIFSLRLTFLTISTELCDIILFTSNESCYSRISDGTSDMLFHIVL